MERKPGGIDPKGISVGRDASSDSHSKWRDLEKLQYTGPAVGRIFCLFQPPSEQGTCDSRCAGNPCNCPAQTDMREEMRAPLPPPVYHARGV